ncbi:TetR/AcrR family transcriptional regulator [Bacillus mesophilum]|uniref:TetR/AcrR family transcriptional regulator n=1 Tax=Bacillus mesophilum TaxID=1071718 RepID=A0A7V7RJ29_9BACI|nr:TetR/AcrR family transcriptional regulator [Bacillus mesophilum]KAB2330649.1 TetR/AcrR family transcriptional regulator [Bacillus mesophilum]
MVKKQLIMEKALELFAEQGFDATSVQQITEKSGISKGAFYLSFKSKDELIFALIDHFMSEIVSNIDYLVSDGGYQKDELLYQFYLTILRNFEEHSNLATVFMKEQTHSLNMELIMKLHFYDKQINRAILKMIDQIYGDSIAATKFDLLYCVKGFMKMYSELFIFSKLPLDLKLLASSLVEKTNLLAKHSTVPFVTKELVNMLDLPAESPPTQETLVKHINDLITDLQEGFVKDALHELREQINNQTLDLLLINGLVETVRQDGQFMWVAFLLRRYFKLS